MRRKRWRRSWARGARFEKGVGYARRPSAFVGGEGLNAVNDFREGRRFGLG